MSSSDVELVKVCDSRIADVTDKIKYAVMKGAENVTPAKFNAISVGSSQITFNIQVPSENTLIDRRVLLYSTVNLNIPLYNKSGADTTAGAILGWAASNSTTNCTALAPFPLHSLFSTIQSTINNQTVTSNIRDILEFLCLFNDTRELNRLNGTCPTMPDNYRNYADALGEINNPLSAYGNCGDNDLMPRGAFASISFDPTIPVVNGNTNPVIVPFSFTSSEPLLLSPWMWSDPNHNGQAIYSIQNLNFTFNIGSLTRVIRTTLKTYNDIASAPASSVGIVGGITFQSTAFQDTFLDFMFLTPHPSQMLPSRNIVPYLEYPRYITQNVGGSIADGQPVPVTSQTIQLNQIPDKLVFCLRKTMGKMKNNDADCFLPLSPANPLSINFNNAAGLLSSATVYDLYRMHVENGGVQNWQQFSGLAIGASANPPAYIKTTGSLIILDFAKDLQLPEMYSCGNLGNFNIQIQANFVNNTGATTGSDDLEFVLLTINSGVWINERGSSSVYTGILTKQQVLEASTQEQYSSSDVKRLVGGSFWDSLKNVASKVANVVKVVSPVAKLALSAVPDPRAQALVSGLNAVGLGQSGGRRDKRLM